MLPVNFSECVCYIYIIIFYYTIIQLIYNTLTTMHYNYLNSLEEAGGTHLYNILPNSGKARRL